ncbi:hypothetical protein AAFF_G00093090 [Aldrovandia affinis]|uniref:Uncharacterized protein n=1 Tax=Aldrovandia affinis TaxID=143900 RepID=A0AAD7T3G0_9TELE|nr:hypothetical protein AAFF_G00093090 [Aldrovandia affinis]
MSAQRFAQSDRRPHSHRPYEAQRGACSFPFLCDGLFRRSGRTSVGVTTPAVSVRSWLRLGDRRAARKPMLRPRPSVTHLFHCRAFPAFVYELRDE